MAGHEPKVVYRYVIEFCMPKADDLAETWTGRARAISPDHVETYLEDRLDKERPGARILAVRVWPAAKAEQENQSDFTEKRIVQQPVPEKKEEQPPNNVVPFVVLPQPKKEEQKDGFFRAYPVSPGLGIAGFANENDEFYSSIPYERNV